MTGTGAMTAGARPARRVWLAALLTLLSACAGLPPSPPPLNPIRFLAINDVYVSDTLADGTGGLARVATVRSRLEDQGPVLFTLAGDFLSPSLLTKYHNGRQMVEALNAAGLDYVTFGNHEFELDRDTLLARIAESEFRWVSANCVQADGTPFPGVLPWDTVRVSGHKVGIFGLTIEGAYRSWARCVDADSSAHEVIATLGAEGADLIVGLTHQTVEADRALLAAEPTLDLILGGHEHEAHDSVVSGRHVLKADANSRTAQFATLWGGKGNWRQAVALLEIDDRLPFDSTTQVVVQRWSDSLRARLGPERVVGTALTPIDGRDAISRQRESPLGDIVTDAMRSVTGADVAVLNSGTLRLDDVIEAGPITNYMLESIFLFADETRVLSYPVTGERLRRLLDHAVGLRGSGGFPQVSGVRFSYDPARPAGERIVGPLQRPDGREIAPGDTIRLALPVYPSCERGDGYEVPEAAGACANREAAPRAADALIRHIAETLGGRVRVPPADRMIPVQP